MSTRLGMILKNNEFLDLCDSVCPYPLILNTLCSLTDLELCMYANLKCLLTTYLSESNDLKFSFSKFSACLSFPHMNESHQQGQ